MKVIFIEDRQERKRIFLGSTKDISEYEFVRILSEEEYSDLKHKFSKDYVESLLKGVNLIIAHKSAFSTNEQSILMEVCKKNSIPMVYFSGGISSSFYSINPVPCLHINSKDFYSENLILFLEEITKGEVELELLQFGNRWRLSILLKLREELSVAIYRLPKEDFIQPEDLAEIFTNERLKILKNSGYEEEITSFIEDGIRTNASKTLEDIKRKLNASIKKML